MAQSGYKYRCIVSNAKGSTSYTFTLKVKSPILGPAVQQTVTLHKTEKATLYINAKNAKSYQWQYLTTLKKWADTKGATGSSYSVTPGLRVKYRCKVNTGAETVESPAFVISEKKELIVAVGKTFTLKVDASNTSLKYKWQYKKAGSTTWTTVKGATKAEYTTPKLTLSNYKDQYRCQVSNSKGKLYTTVMTLQAGKKLKFDVAEVLYNASGGTRDTPLLSGYIGEPCPTRPDTLKMYSDLYPVNDMIRLVRGKNDALLYTIWGYSKNFERKMLVESMNPKINYAETLKSEGYPYFRVVVKTKGDPTKLTSKLPAGSAVYTDAKPLDLKSAATEAHKNFMRRADQYLNFTYTPLSDMRNECMDIKKGVTYKGVMYSSVTGRYLKDDTAVLTEKNVVGIGASWESVATSLKNSNSSIYKDVLCNASGKEVPNGTFYGSVCSGFVSYACDLPGYYSTKVKEPESLLAATYDGDKTLFTKKLDADTVTLKKVHAQVEVGDMMLMENSHSMVVYDVRKFGDKIAEIVIAHQTFEGTRKFMASPDIFVQYLKKGYVLYKNNNVTGVTYTDNAWANGTGSWSAPVMPMKGNSSNWKSGSLGVQFYVKNANGKYSQLVCKGNGQTQSLDLEDKNYKVTVTGLDPGKYTAFLVTEDGTKSASCKFNVIQSSITKKSETKTADGYEYSLNMSFGGVTEAWLMTIYKDSNGYYYKNALTRLDPPEGQESWDENSRESITGYIAKADAKAKFRLLLRNENGWWTSSID